MKSLIIVSILLMIVALIVRRMIKDRKKHKDLMCGGDCSHCPYNGKS